MQLKMDSFVRDAERYRLDIYEEKTGKYRNFTVPDEIYHFIRDYAYKNKVAPAGSKINETGQEIMNREDMGEWILFFPKKE